MSTEEVIQSSGVYIQGGDEFFETFVSCWKDVASMVRKLETRQFYKEPGNPSFEAYEVGDFTRSKLLIEESHQSDIALYADLQNRGVKFERCRLVTRPLSSYLKWEIEHYKFVAQYGEEIYFTEQPEYFLKEAFHDFMVFDNNAARIHDYDESGLIRGGWVISNVSAIRYLQVLYDKILFTSVRMEDFL